MERADDGLRVEAAIGHDQRRGRAADRLSERGARACRRRGAAEERQRPGVASLAVHGWPDRASPRDLHAGHEMALDGTDCAGKDELCQIGYAMRIRGDTRVEIVAGARLEGVEGLEDRSKKFACSLREGIEGRLTSAS